MDTNTLIHADIFFFVSAIAAVVLALILVVIGIYVIRILDDMKKISRRAREEADSISADLQGIRRQFTQEQDKLKAVFHAISGIFGFGAGHKKGRSVKNK